MSDIQRSKKFYTEFLKLEIENDFGVNISFTCGLSIWQLQPEHALQRIVSGNKGVHTKEMYFETRDIDAFYDIIYSRKEKLFHGIHEESWGQKTMRFFDPDGHLIEVGEAMDVFVCRLSDEGESVEGIAQKTRIPIEQIENMLNSSS